MQEGSPELVQMPSDPMPPDQMHDFEQRLSLVPGRLDIASSFLALTISFTEIGWGKLYLLTLPLESLTKVHSLTRLKLTAVGCRSSFCACFDYSADYAIRVCVSCR